MQLWTCSLSEIGTSLPPRTSVQCGKGCVFGLTLRCNSGSAGGLVHLTLVDHKISGILPEDWNFGLCYTLLRFLKHHEASLLMASSHILFAMSQGSNILLPTSQPIQCSLTSLFGSATVQSF